MTDPRDTLITALLDGTEAGTIKWEQANTGATAFIAKRPSGTVTIHGARGSLSTEPISIGSLLGGASAKLIIKNPAGKTLEEIDSPEPASIGVALANNPAARLPKLYDLVHEQVTRAEATMKGLSQEFREPD